MFKPKITVIVLLAGVVCVSLFLCVSAYLSGSEEWVAWAFPSASGVGSLIFVLVKKFENKR